MKSVSLALCAVLCLAGLTALLIVGCGGGGGGGNGTVVQLPTAAELALIEQDSQEINAQAASAGSDHYDDVARQAQRLPSVEYARAEGDTLTVKYKEGGREVWVDPPAWEKPAAYPTAVATQARRSGVNTAELVGGTRAVLINSLAEDNAFAPAFGPLFDEADDLLSAMGYRVERVYGSACDFTAMRNLDGASVVGFVGHGAKVGSNLLDPLLHHIAFQTGQSWTQATRQRYLTDWLLDRVVCMDVPWGTGTKEQRQRNSRRMLAVTNLFFSHYCQGSQSLSHALFYSGACQGLKNNVMANALTSCGVAAYVGWTDTQHYGPWTMVQLFRSMQSGMNLGEAMGSLGPGLKTDDFTDESGRHVRAELQYRPAAGRTLQLGRPGSGVDPFRVTLTWEASNDIDLHVFARPSAHSYYGHKAIPIGELDVDDIDGYGPEHFTARSRIPGTYYVAANYYSDQNYSGSTQLHVQVETRNSVKTYGPHTLRSANTNHGYPIRGNTSSWWRVCDIQVYSDGRTEVRSPDTTVALDNWGYYSVGTRHATQGPRKSYELQSLGIDPSLRPYLHGSSTRSR